MRQRAAVLGAKIQAEDVIAYYTYARITIIAR